MCAKICCRCRSGSGGWQAGLSGWCLPGAGVHGPSDGKSPGCFARLSRDACVEVVGTAVCSASFFCTSVWWCDGFSPTCTAKLDIKHAWNLLNMLSTSCEIFHVWIFMKMVGDRPWAQESPGRALLLSAQPCPLSPAHAHSLKSWGRTKPVKNSE